MLGTILKIMLLLTLVFAIIMFFLVMARAAQLLAVRLLSLRSQSRNHSACCLLWFADSFHTACYPTASWKTLPFHFMLAIHEVQAEHIHRIMPHTLDK